MTCLDAGQNARVCRPRLLYPLVSCDCVEFDSTMTSPPPAQGSKRRRVRDAVERNVRRVRRTFRPSPSARPSSPSGSSAASPSTRSPSPSPPGSHILTSGSQPAPPNASGTTVLVAGPSMLGARPASAPVSRTQATSHRSSTLEKLKDAREVAWNGLETTLRALGKSADEFPPLRSAVDSLVACLDIVQVSPSCWWADID